jgi:hypothetical protein
MGEDEEIISKELLEILACPFCKGDIRLEGSELVGNASLGVTCRGRDHPSSARRSGSAIRSLCWPSDLDDPFHWKSRDITPL